MQGMIGLKIFKNAFNVQTWISFIGSNSLVIPSICAKIAGKKLIKIVAGSDSEVMKFQRDNLKLFIRVISFITHLISDKIVIYSPYLIKEWGLERFNNKIVIAPHHFIDFDKFFIKKEFTERQQIIGYVGRFSAEKGILNLLNGIARITSQFNFKYLIIGDGPQMGEVLKIIKKINKKELIQLYTWLPHESLNDFLNEMKLIVIPSYSEGLPNILLEAMAAGTPVFSFQGRCNTGNHFRKPNGISTFRQ